MPAKSQVQQRLMAMALHSPEKVHKENAGVMGMSKESLKEYASAKRKKLPKYAGKGKNYLRSAMGED